MEDRELKQLVADTGRVLLEKGLVARTWGNISARKDNVKFAISPSGLGYEHMQGADVPIYDTEQKTWEGNRKPSSEKRIHAIAYRLFPDVNFVIHTHQDYASALAVAGVGNLKLSEEEKNVLGGVSLAAYGLPGTKKLAKNVEAAFKDARTILMEHHGALILGKDRDDAIMKAELLEKVCERVVTEKIGSVSVSPLAVSEEMAAMMKAVTFTSDENIIAVAKGRGFRAQLDDMAQMLGTKISVVPPRQEDILSALNKRDAVLVEGLGCMIKCEKEDDEEALKLLVKKAASAKRYTEACGIKGNLSAFDCILMRTVYKLKYSKKKGS